MTLNRICRILKQFKHKYLEQQEENVHNNNLNRRTIIQRENILINLINAFNNKPYFEQLYSLSSKLHLTLEILENWFPNLIL